MLKIKEYVKAESLEQAYELNQKRTNRIIGGMLWMRMSDAQIQKAIDLSGLGLDQIEETEDAFILGCMVTLRQMELHEGLNAMCGGLIRKSVEDIVGVQFRNLATVGGSLVGRFGFSDVLTGLLVLDTYVELYKGGTIPLAEYANMRRDNDILVHVIIKKTAGRYAYQAHRNTKTDFPVLAVAASMVDGKVKAAVGARPQRARLYLADAPTQEAAEALAAAVVTGSNMRASAEYRSHLAKVLLKRAFAEIREKEEQ